VAICAMQRLCNALSAILAPTLDFSQKVLTI
jgi:hypothetical protein